MAISRSTRHQKVIGEYGEMLVCNWLSRAGFEVARVDHTGIDLIAFKPDTGKRFGISVKSRTRAEGTERASIFIFKKPKHRDRKKLLAACKAFGCEPWVAVYAETTDGADLFLTSLENFDAKYAVESKQNDDWLMSKRSLRLYQDDPEIKRIHVSFDSDAWW